MDVLDRELRVFLVRGFGEGRTGPLDHVDGRKVMTRREFRESLVHKQLADEQPKDVFGAWCPVDAKTRDQGASFTRRAKLGQAEGKAYANYEEVARQQENVLGSSADLWMDIDKMPAQEWRQLVAKLKRAQVSGEAWSTASYDKDSELVSARVHLHLDRELRSADEIKLVRQCLNDLLFDKRADRACFSPQAVFYVPAKRKHAFVIEFDGSELCVDEWLEDYAPAEKARDRTPVTISVDSKLDTDWAPELVAQAKSFLEDTCLEISTDRSEHLREFIVKRVRILGGYVGAGLLDWEDTVLELETACYQRAAGGAPDDKTAADRTQQCEELLQNGTTAPLAPRISPSASEEQPSTGMDRLRLQLVNQAPARIYTREEAGAALHTFLRKRVFPGEVKLAEISVGVGKTFAARQLAAERSARGEYTVIVSLDHALLGQIRRDLNAAGVETYTVSSVTQPEEKTGMPQCARHDEAEVRLIVAEGGSVQASLCRKCPLKNECLAIKARREANDARVVLAPYDMADRALATIDKRKDSPGAPLLICDEEPPAPELVSIDHDDLRKLGESPVWRFFRGDQAKVLQTMRVLLLRDRMEEFPQEAILELQACYGQFHDLKITRAQAKIYKKQLATLRTMMKLVYAWETVENEHTIIDDGETQTVEDKVLATIPGRVWRTLRDEGGFVLSATPTPVRYVEAGLNVDELVLRVEDAPGTLASRTILYTSHASRSKIFSDEGIQWKLVEGDLQQIFDIIDPLIPGARILIGTYKRVAEGLRGEMRHLLQERDIELVHYEVARGRDDWADRDVFVSLYDPRPGGRSTMAEKNDHAVRLLEQFHGRSRDPQPRARGAAHIHIGTLAPLSWYQKPNELTTTELKQRPTGRPQQLLLDNQRELVQAYIATCGGFEEAASLAGVSPRTLRRYAACKGGLSKRFLTIASTRVATNQTAE